MKNILSMRTVVPANDAVDAQSRKARGCCIHPPSPDLRHKRTRRHSAMHTKAVSAWELIKWSRNFRIRDLDGGLELQGDNIRYEEWALRRRTAAAFIASMPVPDGCEKPHIPHFYAWTGTRHRQIFAAYPERAPEGRFLLSVQTRGPMFPPSLWDRYVEAERAMAPVSYAVIACGLAFLGFAAWWMR